MIAFLNQTSVITDRRYEHTANLFAAGRMQDLRGPVRAGATDVPVMLGGKLSREDRSPAPFHRYDVRRRNAGRDAIRRDRDRAPRRGRLCLGWRWAELVAAQDPGARRDRGARRRARLR